MHICNLDGWFWLFQLDYHIRFLDFRWLDDLSYCFYRKTLLQLVTESLAGSHLESTKFLSPPVFYPKSHFSKARSYFDLEIVIHLLFAMFSSPIFLWSVLYFNLNSEGLSLILTFMLLLADYAHYRNEIRLLNLHWYRT